MKHCLSCQEDFSDKFSFCPVCGTPLNATKAEPVSVQNFRDESITSPSSIKPTVAASDFLIAEQLNVHEAVTEKFVTEDEFSSNRNGASFNFADAATVGANISDITPSETVSLEDFNKASDSLIRKDEDYHLTFLDDKGVTSRLISESSALAREFIKDPVGFTKNSFNSFGQLFRQLLKNKSAMAAIGLAFATMIILVAVANFLDRTQSTAASRAGIVLFSIASAIMLLGIFAGWVSRDKQSLQYGTVGNSRQIVSESGSPWFLFAGILTVFVGFVMLLGLFKFADSMRAKSVDATNEEVTAMIDPTEIPEEQKKPDKGNAGEAKGKGGGSKPKQEKPGGGGGQDNQKPASQGKIPQASLEVPQIIPPSIDPPRVKNPSLPVPATVVADPTLFPPDPRNVPYGDPRSKSTDPSMGDGKGSGIGGGDGGGVGPGRGGNTGGGDRNDGGGGPGGGGGGDTDYTRTFKANEVTQKAVITYKAQPEYTEEARKNQVQGVVRVQAVLNANGSVTGIRAISTLPFGLTDKAIAATRRVQFIPAKKDGRNVSQYVTLEYSFRIY
jgi:TonB family protein